MRTRTFELHSIVTGIGAATGEKLLVRATLHNADQIAALDLREGDMVYVEKGGEEKSLSVEGGFGEVKKNRVTVCCV